MRFLLASTAIATAMALSPAFAQEVSAPLAEPPVVAESPDATVPDDSKLIVQGVTPAEALSSIDTGQLVESPPPADAVVETPTAEVPATEATVTAEAATETAPETEIATAAESSASVDQLASVEVDLPAEVQAVAMNDRYTTAELVAAQLQAIQNAPMAEPPASDAGAPVFDRAGEPGAWSQSATPGEPAASPDAAAPTASDSL